MKKAIIVSVLLFFLLSQWMIFIVNREHWFDVSFSLETANELNNGEKINFRSHDVHPPTYYLLLASWLNLNPGISEYHWAQELSVLFLIVFLIFAGLSLSKMFGREGELALFFLSICTTYLHYGTEVRQYSLLLAVSAILFYSIVVKDLRKGWFPVAAVLLIMLPMIHYFAVITAFFYLGLFFIMAKRRKLEAWKRKFWLMFGSAILGVLWALTYALPQKARVAGTWFQPPFVTDWPSAVMYSFFMTDLYAPKGLMVLPFLLMYVSLALFLVWLGWKGFKSIKKDISEDKILLILMFSTALFPLAALAGAPLLGGDGFAHLYHHRFFLPLLWMFASATLILIFRHIKRVVAISVLTLVVFGMLFIYQKEIVHTELMTLMANTPCPKNNTIMIAHESPFSALPFEVWAREHDCGWFNFVSTNMSQRALNGGGGDALNPDQLFLNQTLPEGDYYVIYAAGTVPIDGTPEKLHLEDGVELWYVHRDTTNRSGQKRITWYDNSTEYQYTRINWTTTINRIN